MTVVSLDEHRARRADDAHLDYAPLPAAESLFAARALLARLEGQHHVEPDHENARCDDCDHDVLVAWTYGTRTVCRTCRRARIRAAHFADTPLPAGPPQPDPVAELEAKAERWVRHVAGRKPVAWIQVALERHTGIPRTTVHRLADLAADLARAETPTTIRTDDDAARRAEAP